MKKKSEYLPENRKIQKAAGHFKEWLKEKSFAKGTIYRKGKHVIYFLNYLEKENININQAAYTDLLDFVNYCRKANHSTAHTNKILLALRSYFTYLEITRQLTAGNPADGLKLKGEIQKVISGILSKEELEQVYKQYTEANYPIKNKTILGLLIYQALTLEDINRLETGDIKLREGKIRIAGNKQKNGRVLKLEPHQILDLQEYILNERGKLLSKYPGETSQLFLTSKGKTDMRNTLATLFKQAREINPLLKNTTQIRISIITDWLKHYNLREAQYMAGHKKVKSTERYKTQDMEELSKALEKFHPLG